MSSTWNDIKATWDQGWNFLAEQATALYDSIASNPQAFQPTVESFVKDLEASRANLDAIKAALPKHPATPEEKAALRNYFELEDRYHALAAGLYSDAEPAQQTRTGIIPVLIVAGLAVGVAGTAWAATGYEYASNLREQTALASKELDARIQASQEGRTLQPTTLPETATSSGSSLFEDPMKTAKGLGTLLVGGLVVAAGALTLPALLKRR